MCDPFFSLPAKAFLTLVCLSASAMGICQGVAGTFDLADPPDVVILLEARGSDHRPIDTALVDEAGNFQFLPRSDAHGFYQLAIDEDDRLDIILTPNETEVVLTFSGRPLQEHITVDKGPENDRLWQYKDLSRRVQGTQRMVMAERAATPEDDIEVHQALDSLIEMAFTARDRFFAQLLEQWPDSYFARLVRANEALDAALGKGPGEVIEAIDLSDPALMRSSIYPKAVLSYLALLATDDERTFVDAADTLIARASNDTACRAFMIEHLVELFATYGPDLALLHVVQTHVAAAEGLSSFFRDQAMELIGVATGGVGPDVPLPKPGGDTTQLATLLALSEHTLLFFYASGCSSCHEQMPLLAELHRAENGMNVIGIALDRDPEEFFTTIHEEDLPWPSFSELNGWGSKAADAYKVKATPTLVLLDAQRRILARPRDAEELRVLLLQR